MLTARNDPAFHQVLTSVERNINLESWSANARTLGLPLDLPVSIAKQRLQGGRQEGAELITINTGTLQVRVIPSRGMGILDVSAGDIRLGWLSPIQQVVHPKFVRLESRGGLGWLEGFNEWLVRCGLEFAGAPGKDNFITNTGAHADMDLTLHGKIANIPASEVVVSVDREPPYEIRLRGRVDEVMFYGPKLELWTELAVQPGRDTFELRDTILNRGGADQEFELIYHINYGPPLLEAGASCLGAVRRVFPVNAHAARFVSDYASFDKPTMGFVEQVYGMEPLANDEGFARFMLKNAAGNRGASTRFAPEQLPCFTLWKNTNALEEGCVTGFEPGTNYPFNRRIERQAGRLMKLKAGEQREFNLQFGIHLTAEAVGDVEREIQRCQQRQEIQIDAEPPHLS